MIVWNGLGILVILSVILGLSLGGGMARAIGHEGLVMFFGFLLAALANWVLWKLIKRKQTQVLIDPATGQQVVIHPNHSLFFIPIRFWTWIFAGLALFNSIEAVQWEIQHAKNIATPGYAEFKAADNLISANQYYAKGNNEAAKQAAQDFSKSVKSLCLMNFSGGDSSKLTKNDFVTYCQEGSESIVFLCEVPSLEKFKDEDVKQSLCDIAWTTATMSAAPLHPNQKKKLVVGLRDTASSYAFILTGAPSSTSHEKVNPKTEEATSFYPAFANPGQSLPSTKS